MGEFGVNNIPVYLINLDTDEDRLEFMDDQLNALSMNYERFPAVRGTAMPDWLKPYFLDDAGNIASQLTAGEIGCYASHLAIMKRVADDGRTALVLEDDIEIATDFTAILSSLNRLPDGWEVIRLSNPFKKRFVSVSPIAGRYQAVKFSSVPPSTGAYLITPEGARKFLNWRQLRFRPVDQDMRRIWDCGLVTYGVHPRPVIPDIGVSTIDTMGRKKTKKQRESFFDSLRRIVFDIKWLGIQEWLLSLISKPTELAKLP